MRAPLLHLGRALLCVVLAGCAAADDEPEDPQFPAALVGAWVQLCPVEGALDTTVLHRDGRITGSKAAFDSMAFEQDRWWVGADLMPGGFCAGPAHRTNPSICQGWFADGDSVVLGTQQRTLWVRAGTFRVPSAVEHQSVCKRHQARHSPAPAPGDSVQAPGSRTGVRERITP
jgi:hypothetical protein